MHKRILILGASGFIGNALYKELLSYFEVYGTYCMQHGAFSENQVFYRFCAEEDSLFLLLNEIQPTVIISVMNGNFKSQLVSHKDIVNYALLNNKTSVLYVSSAEVFDGKSEFPSYEEDKPLATSDYGKFKISIEKLLLEQIPNQTTILRLPLVLGINSPVMLHLRQTIKHQAAFEVFPKLIISVTTASKIAQQVHYIINKNLKGIYHLASTDMVHHEDLFREILAKISSKKPIFKSVFSSNYDQYFSILPKKNILPKPHQITVAEVIEETTLKEEIETLNYK